MGTEAITTMEEINVCWDQFKRDLESDGHPDVHPATFITVYYEHEDQPLTDKILMRQFMVIQSDWTSEELDDFFRDLYQYEINIDLSHCVGITQIGLNKV